MSDSITIMRAGTADRDHLRDLAELDSRRTPSEPALMAYVDGELRAAIGLRDGLAVADPFHRTDDVMRLLRRAAETRRGQPGGISSGPSSCTKISEL